MTCGATWDDVRGASFAGNDVPLIGERTAPRGVATESGDEHTGVKRGLQRPSTSYIGTPAANDAARDAHASRWPWR